MIKFTNKDFLNMHYLHRNNLVNSSTGYKSANLIGTKSKDHNENLAVFSSVTHLGSNPALLGFFLRPTTVLRNTYENIKETEYYTLNHIHENIIEDAHHTSAKYEKTISEFDYTNLEPEYKDDYFPPFVKNTPVQLLMKFENEYPIIENNTILIVGKLEALFVIDDLIEEDYFINLSKAKVASINGLDGYAIPNLKKRFEYQRPKKNKSKITNI